MSKLDDIMSSSYETRAAATFCAKEDAMTLMTVNEIQIELTKQYGDAIAVEFLELVVHANTPENPSSLMTALTGRVDLVSRTCLELLKEIVNAN